MKNGQAKRGQWQATVRGTVVLVGTVVGVGACENADLTFDGYATETFPLQDASLGGPNDGGALSLPSVPVSPGPRPSMGSTTAEDATTTESSMDSSQADASLDTADSTPTVAPSTSLGVDGGPVATSAEVSQVETTQDAALDAGGRKDASADGGTDGDAADGASGGALESCSDCESSHACMEAACDTATGSCILTPLINAACDDGNACTSNDRCNGAGECVGAATDCSALDDQCTEGACEPATGACVARPKPANTTCNDDNGCTVDDVCNGQGVCAGKARDCSSLDSDCREGVCDPDTGACAENPVRAGDSCDDDNACTTNDRCTSDGRCGGEAVSCASEDGPCTEGVCNSQTGRCEARPLNDGQACDDDDECTALDVCEGGECKGVEADTCDEAVELDVSSGKASLTMSTGCAKNDFRLLQLLDPDSDCFSTYGPDVMITIDLTGYDERVRLRASTDNTDTDFDTVLALTTAECSEDAMLACDDDGGANLTSEISIVLEPDVYVLVVDGFHGGEKGLFQLDVEIDED